MGGGCGWREPDQLVHQARVAHVGIGGAVAEGEQVACVVCGRRSAPGALKAVDAPARGQMAGDRAHQLAHGVGHGVSLPGADRQQHVAVAARRIEVVMREVRHPFQAPGSQCSQAVAAIEQRGAERDRDGQLVRRIDRSENARVRRRVVELLRADRVALRERAGAGAESSQRRFERRAVGGDRVERHERRLRLRRREDPGLVGPVEGDARGELVAEGDPPLRGGGGALRRGVRAALGLGLGARDCAECRRRRAAQRSR